MNSTEPPPPPSSPTRWNPRLESAAALPAKLSSLSPSSWQIRILALVVALALTTLLFHLLNCWQIESAKSSLNFGKESDVSPTVIETVRFVDSTARTLAYGRILQRRYCSGEAVDEHEQGPKCCSKPEACAGSNWSLLNELMSKWKTMTFLGNGEKGKKEAPKGDTKTAELCDVHFEIWQQSVGEAGEGPSLSEKALDLLLGTTVSGERSWLSRLTGVRAAVYETAFRGRNGLYDWRIVGEDAKDEVATCKDFYKPFLSFDAEVDALADTLREAVAGPRWLLRALNGPLQFIIVVAAFWAALLLTARWVTASRRPEWANTKIAAVKVQDDPVVEYLERDDRVFDGWLMEALPLLGFIGTVIGMIGAMGRIGEVVSAEAGTDLERQVGLLSGELSLAFSTTFLALAATLLLSLPQGQIFAFELQALRRAWNGDDAG